jgi:signal transduction histidine kinase
MMQGKQAGELIDDYAEPIERSLQRIQGMRNLIMDLLDFTKIRLERKEEKIQEVKLSDIASGAITTAQPYSIQMDVSIETVIKSDVAVMADPDDMEIVFNNLISNAIKYNKPGGKVKIVIDSTAGEVILVISDTGIGISKDDIDNLFTEFVRIRNEKTRNISGSGLGLSIVKKVIGLYHGTISVESTPDVGTSFTIQIPKKQANISEN